MKPLALAGVLTLCTITLFSCKKKPKACFTFSKETAKVGDTITLQNCSTNFVNNTWTFPGGGTNTQANPRIKLAQAGPYEVILTVTDGSKTETDVFRKELVVLP
jgi:PKD repeat protein